ncbi:MAG TPA: ABC transporter ATP-binding protein [Puia sp.]|nr:ABC transporter ATP-binding protein [Puia sp.]
MSAGRVLLHTHALQTGYRQGGRRVQVSVDLPSLQLCAGQMICLLGPNGSGKSTLLRTLAGLQPPLDGRVEIEGRWGLSAAELARKISLVLTDRITGINLDVYALVALGRYPWSGWLGGLKDSDKTAITRAIDAAGIGDLLERKVHTLSDGENQKVMLARALAQDTPILMLDEPTAHLDLPSRIRLMRLLNRLARELNKGILLSTHELDLAMQVADEVWLLQAAGPFHRGAPEDLILDGVFEAVFAREGVVFDREAGVFRIPPEGNRRIRLEGQGMAAFWTRRALQREGFVLDERGTGESGMDAGTVRIIAEDGRTVWVLESGQTVSRFESIGSLLQGLDRPGLPHA